MGVGGGGGGGRRRGGDGLRITLLHSYDHPTGFFLSGPVPKKGTTGNIVLVYRYPKTK